MRKTITLGALVALLMILSGCSEPKSGGVDQSVAGTVSDTQALKEAEAAANDIIRNAADCEAVSASFATVTAKLAEVEGRLQTPVGRTTIETLKKQVGTIGDACGVR